MIGMYYRLSLTLSLYNKSCLQFPFIINKYLNKQSFSVFKFPHNRQNIKSTNLICMKIRHRTQNLFHRLSNHIFCQRTFFLRDLLKKLAASQEFRHNKDIVSVHVILVNLDDIPVVDFYQQLDLVANLRNRDHLGYFLGFIHQFGFLLEFLGIYFYLFTLFIYRVD